MPQWAQPLLTSWGRRISFKRPEDHVAGRRAGTRAPSLEAGVGRRRSIRPEFRAMNPHGRVAVIEDGGTVVGNRMRSSLSGRRYGQGIISGRLRRRTFASPTSGWIGLKRACIRDFLMDSFGLLPRTPEPQRDWPPFRDKSRALSRAFPVLDELLADRPFLCGNASRLADIPAGTSPIAISNWPSSDPGIPNVTSLYPSPPGTPSYREHVMVPFADLRGRLRPLSVVGSAVNSTACSRLPSCLSLPPRASPRCMQWTDEASCRGERPGRPIHPRSC